MSEIMSNNKQTNSAPVVAEWRKFTFHGKHTMSWVYAGVAQFGKIWLQLANLRNTIFFESGGALNLDELDELVSKLPERQYGTILLPTSAPQEYYDIKAITPSGIFEVKQQLVEDSSQPEQASRAVVRFWDWFKSEVFPQLRELAAKQRPKGEAMTPKDCSIELDDVPDDEEIEAVENALRRKSEPLRCKLVILPEQGKKPESSRDNTVSIWEFSEILQFNGLKITPSMLHDYFKRCGWLCKKEHDMPTSFALNTGLFTIVSTKTVRPPSRAYD